MAKTEVVKTHFFPHPEPARLRSALRPVFLTLAGCAGRCLFCAQDKQSGTPERSLQSSIASLEALLSACDPAKPFELAFYGGTFTALPNDFAFRFLETAAPYRKTGLITGVRCSTRPDAVSPGLLGQLAQAGLTCVELGVQTFQDLPLSLSLRGYDATTCHEACAQVCRAGLRLGVHLMAGLPGHVPDHLPADAAACARAGAEFVRLHPCLVLEGSGLEALWKSGAFQPWSLDTCLEALPPAVLALWEAGVSVARIGLAPEPSLAAATLAGPWHPALGTRVRARALLRRIQAQSEGGRLLALRVPTRYSGELWGHAHELVPLYQALGLERAAVAFTQDEGFELTVRA